MPDINDIYKINVLDIVDAWAGYPLRMPCYPNAAQNSGTLQIRCFINNQCPFNMVDAKDDTIVFNIRTLNKILPQLQDEHRIALDATPGTEGIHFTPKYVFRHNYIYEIKNEFVGEGEAIDGTIEGNRYQEISSGRGNVSGADETRYKDEQTWYSVPSIFDVSHSNAEGEEECTNSTWAYQPYEESETSYAKKDIEYDYNTATWDRYNSGDIEAIDTGLVQMPWQVRTRDSLGKGVHWRLIKKTPLYRGEDFFIKFYKTAKSTTADVGDEEIPNFKIPDYRFLDVTETDRVVWDPAIPDLTVPINFAVKPAGEPGSNNTDPKFFDFSSQAYYVIELGYQDPNNNIFIIINERTYPVCINVQNGISRIIGKFTDLKGKQLIDADNFKMTVRNHLGTLVVYFEAPSLKTSPWIIEKDVWSLEWKEETNTPILETKTSILSVPRGLMTIWGGNLQCGFIFGPLQYVTSEVNMLYPPRKIVTPKDTLSMDITGGTGISGTSGTSGTSGEGGEAIHEQPFWLPMNVNHHVKFSLPDIDKYEFEKEVSVGGKDFIIFGYGNRDKMFTQDAQFYKEYRETGYRKRALDECYGSYYYRETPKEITFEGRTSGLEVYKYKYVNDRQRRKQAFNIGLKLMAGDHTFREGWVPLFPDTGGGRGVWEYVFQPDDNQWFLPQCKTPILTSLRLISEEGNSPRWDDGTNMEEGVSLLPQTDNPHFFEATDHVLSYSDSWQSVDWTHIEHTGSINFLLSSKMPFANNVTNKLYSLQNKTFYIEIWAGYQNCNYANVNGFFKLFTGMCHGGTIEYQYGERNIMSCKIVDYNDILKDQLFFNAPFFDGMRDINAINEILKMAGFRYRGPFDPGKLINYLTTLSNMGHSTTFFYHIDGRLYKMEPFALPSGYNRLEQPMFKFDEGSSLFDGIKEIATKSAKTFYFDQMGIAHFEDLQDVVERDYRGEVPLIPLFYFTTNPELYPGQMVFNQLQHTYDVNSVYNHLKMMSNTPDMELLLYDDLNWSSYDNPNTEGFKGYTKTFFSREPMLGSKSALIHATNKYRTMFRPASLCQFETYGIPLRANDIISINGETTRVIKVNHNLDPSENKWWMDVECEKFQPVGTITKTS